MNKVCPGEVTVRGIDISPYQPKVDWKTLSQSDVEFVFIKASEGLTYRSPVFADHFDHAKAAGLMRGAYHFFRPELDPLKQANNFLEMIRFKYEPTDIPPVLDWETHSGRGPKWDINAALVWLNEVERVIRKRPIIYTNPSRFNELGSPPQFKDYPLWIANYQVKCPFIPLPWTSWKFWQCADHGQIPGIQGPCDVDIFNGSLDELKKFALT